MSNIHGLFSGGNGKDDDSNRKDNDDENSRYVGGIGDRGGGSGLAVQPNPDAEGVGGGGGLFGGGGGGGERDSVFRLAQNATAEDQARVRRTITMYRDGFVVDDGPYRRLDDPENAEFLRALAMGRTPRELYDQAKEQGKNVTVGLVDKRTEEYVEEFRSFSGQGNTLGAAPATTTTSEGAAGGESSVSDDTFDSETLSMLPVPTLDATQPTTSIQVRLPSGRRRVLKINLGSTVTDLAVMLREDAVEAFSSPALFRLVSGFPPKPLDDPASTIEDAGLRGAQVSMQKA